jgi:hypothetical protein
MVMKRTLRITLDIAMIVLLLFTLACRITGGAIHKWGGIGVFTLFAIHIFINRHWFKIIFKGIYRPRRALLTAVNLLLAIAASTLIITGVLEALWTPSFLLIESGITLREMHTTAAYWLLPITGVHLGLHWEMFSKIIGKNSLFIVITRILAILFFAFGAWSFYDRDMLAKLFLGFSFDYWPLERPLVLFFAETLSIMGIFVFTTYYCMKLINRIKLINLNCKGGFL